MDCAEYRELAAADVDGELSFDERQAADAHVGACAGCAAERRLQANARVLVRRRAATGTTPSGLRQQVVARLDAVEVRSAPALRRGRRIPAAVRVAIVGTIAALVVLFLRSSWETPEPHLLSVLAENVRALDAGGTDLAVRTEKLEEIKEYYRTTGRIEFERSADDFSHLGLRLVGGRIDRLGDTYTTFTVYEGAAGRVLCRRFRAGTVPLPEGGERIGDAIVFTVEDVTVCIMRFGDVVCCLASSMPREVFTRHLVAAKHL